ncbi:MULTISPECIES: DUF3290 family protein [Streptococcus]|jgi:hypothetical protein|uniref:DUF3290 domain-containing protein n=4 Tax=Bacteria TaxID=2 RepID=A0A1S0Z6S2_SALET|nr:MULTISPECIES: DUF3290 family protein [Streptococcus]ANR74622.1 hypothetical protein AXF18_01065 [Streptococcus sp. oral taxon 064]ATF56185.1 DUF3290 domain-containing protein [Streptococcus oralis]MBK3298429.1 DUF3290 domain-containing protein [Streptococcus oralis]MBR8666894.1 DUF3290 domain-containing protein [Streptococcus oralis]MBS9397365.1 DUF3290 domain-containing protein [Streptococcus oralis]
MKFYSYDYVLSQISQQNGIMIGFGIVLLAITGFFAFKAYRDKKGTKFRELVMILALTLVAMLLVTISKYQTNQASNNQFQTSLHFIEVVSKDLGVDKSEVYVNTSADTDGALIKVGSNFYRAMNGSQPDKYLLEKLELHQTDAIELVEVNK